MSKNASMGRSILQVINPLVRSTFQQNWLQYLYRLHNMFELENQVWFLLSKYREAKHESIWYKLLLMFNQGGLNVTF